MTGLPVSADPLPLSLAGARILVSNDDGINAPGLAVLEQVARALTDDVWVCAPEGEQSAASHSITLNRPLRLRRLGPKRFAVEGTPTDCVLLAMAHVFKGVERRPDLVLSGINHGENLGDDVTYSGTIAAAIEATILGVPAIAFSQQIRDGAAADFSVAGAFAADVVRHVTALGWPPGVLINVNFPAIRIGAVTGIHAAPHGRHKHGDTLSARHDPRGRLYFWLGAVERAEAEPEPSSDIAIVAAGGISVTPLSIDINHKPTLTRLAERLGTPRG